jgi:hypothetical protein
MAALLVEGVDGVRWKAMIREDSKSFPKPAHEPKTAAAM